MRNNQNGDIRDAYRCLREYRKHLSRHQLKTLLGQIKAGDVNGAMNGLDKVLTRKGV